MFVIDSRRGTINKTKANSKAEKNGTVPAAGLYFDLLMNKGHDINTNAMDFRADPRRDCPQFFGLVCLGRKKQGQQPERTVFCRCSGSSTLRLQSPFFVHSVLVTLSVRMFRKGWKTYD